VFLPLRHENSEGRRLPVISLALVVINLVVFLATNGKIQEQQEAPQRGTTRAHILLLVASHPELAMPANVKDMVDAYKTEHPDLWAQAQAGNREIADGWDARVRLLDEEAPLQAEMNALVEEYDAPTVESFADKYAFIPAHPRALTYLTANFLHGGWLHLIGNMWFLWLAGAILEDTWGRLIYPAFYLVAGAAALQFHAWTNPGSMVPALGASGAVAALMGAFLVRFPNTKIEVAVIFSLRSIANLALGKGIRFQAKAYWLLPFWLLSEIFSGFLFGKSSGVAHWAHVGGFIFGGLAALGLRYSGLEQIADKAIEAKVSWTADPAIVTATEDMSQGRVDSAIATLKTFVTGKPDSVEGLTLLHQAQWRKNDLPGYRDTISKLIQVHLKNQNVDGALQEYQDFKNSGGEALPSATWLELCRAIEGQGNHERAVGEYDLLAKACPAERPALLALLAAGRLSLKNLHRPAEALRFYETAANSPVPHLDWETNIRKGIEDSKKALVPVSA